MLFQKTLCRSAEANQAQTLTTKPTIQTKSMVERSGGVQRGNTTQVGCARRKKTQKFTEKSSSAHLETAHLKKLFTHAAGVKEKKSK